MTVTGALSVLWLASVCASSSLSRHQLELKEHYEHLSYIAAFRCHDPQPRVIPVSQLLSHYQTRGKAYFPDVSVLFRCDAGVGCCEADQRCGPLHAIAARLPFKVTYLEDMGDHKRGSWEMEYFSLDNHTECGCFDTENVSSHKLESSSLPPHDSGSKADSSPGPPPSLHLSEESLTQQHSAELKEQELSSNTTEEEPLKSSYQSEDKHNSTSMSNHSQHQEESSLTSNRISTDNKSDTSLESSDGSLIFPKH